MNNNPNIQVLKASETGIFTNYIYKAIPLAFDESMSYYECLCGLLNYLKNVVIPTLNNNADAVIELQQLYEELHDYVQHYFDNLDVQEEINNKLDDMVEQGTLQDIITTYLNAKAPFCYDTVALMKEAENLINGSFAITLGYSSLNDGKGALYKITNTPSVTDVQETLDNGLYATLINNNTIVDFNSFQKAINDDNSNSNYISSNSTITVNQITNLTSIDQCKNKCFTGGTFVLNTNMFSGNGLNYFDIPNFVNCTFIGNGYSIVNDNSYSINGRFVNCNFINCSFMKNGTFVQSAKFVNCYIENTIDNDFIKAGRIYETRFINCQMESNNKAHLINATSTTSNHVTIDNVTLENCIFESQTNEIIIARDVSNLNIYNLYTENNSKPFIEITGSNRASHGIFAVSIKGSRLQCDQLSTYFIKFDDTSKYNNSAYSMFLIECSSIDQCTLSNLYDFYKYQTIDVRCYSNGNYKCVNENSKISSQKNSIADFTSSTTLTVKKFPALITFDSSDGGWHTNAYLVSLGYNNNPNVTCLTNPSASVTSSYDSETGYVNVTLHVSSGSSLNRSAVLLSGINNNLNPNDYWNNNSGYTV